MYTYWVYQGGIQGSCTPPPLPTYPGGYTAGTPLSHTQVGTQQALLSLTYPVVQQQARSSHISGWYTAQSSPLTYQGGTLRRVFPPSLRNLGTMRRVVYQQWDGRTMRRVVSQQWVTRPEGVPEVITVPVDVPEVITVPVDVPEGRRRGRGGLFPPVYVPERVIPACVCAR